MWAHTSSMWPIPLFLGIIDASSRWSHVSLLATRNVAFARLLAQIIQLRANFSEYQIKSIGMDNAGEFTSQAFNDYCMSIGINVEHSVAHVHTQNGLAESLIKRLQLIARPILMRCKLPSSAWGHAILHAAALIKLRPTADHEYSPLQLSLEENQVYPISKYLVVRFMYQYRHHNAPKWDHREDWAFTLVLTPSLSLNI
jgi:hypothetical protein